MHGIAHILVQLIEKLLYKMRAINHIKSIGCCHFRRLVSVHFGNRIYQFDVNLPVINFHSLLLWLTDTRTKLKRFDLSYLSQFALCAIMSIVWVVYIVQLINARRKLSRWADTASDKCERNEWDEKKRDGEQNRNEKKIQMTWNEIFVIVASRTRVTMDRWKLAI